jgi:hypothetical protein
MICHHHDDDAVNGDGHHGSAGGDESTDGDGCANGDYEQITFQL